MPSRSSSLSLLALLVALASPALAAPAATSYAPWAPALGSWKAIDVVGPSVLALDPETGDCRLVTRSGAVLGPFDHVEAYEPKGAEAYLRVKSDDYEIKEYLVAASGEISELPPPAEPEAGASGSATPLESEAWLETSEPVGLGGPYGEVGNTTPAYVVKGEAGYFVLRGTEKYGPFYFSDRGWLGLSKDGKTLGYVYKSAEEGKYRLSWAGVEYEYDGSIWSWFQAPDGSEPWVWVSTDAGLVLHHGKKPWSAPWREVMSHEGKLVFDPSNKTPAFVGLDDAGTWVVAGAKKVGPFMSLSPSIAWPAGAAFPWYAGRVDGTWTLVAGSAKYQAFYTADSIGWFIPRQGNQAPLWVESERTLGSSTFHEGKASLLSANTIELPVLSADGSRYALIARGGPHKGMDALIYGDRYVFVGKSGAVSLEKYGPFIMAEDIGISPSGGAAWFEHGDIGEPRRRSIVIGGRLLVGRPGSGGAIVFDGARVQRIAY